MNNIDSIFNVDLNNYQGPLDVLLDLAKAQKVNLEDISITKLADQFHYYITNKKDLNLETASEYLLMATRGTGLGQIHSGELSDLIFHDLVERD